MHNTITKSILAVMVAVALLLPGVQSAKATSATWNGTTDGTWATSGNWSGSPATVPGTGDTATFNGAGNGNRTLNLGAGVTISTVLFDTASAGAYTIGSGAVGNQTLILNNSGTIALSSTVTNNQLFNANLTLGTVTTAQSFNFGATNLATTLTLAGSVTHSSTVANYDHVQWRDRCAKRFDLFRQIRRGHNDAQRGHGAEHVQRLYRGPPGHFGAGQY